MSRTKPEPTRSRSLLGRMVAAYVLIALVFAATWTWSLFGPLESTITAQQQDNLKAIARSAAAAVTDTDESLETTVKELVSGTDIRLTVVDSTGSVLADSQFEAATMENHKDRPEIEAALRGSTSFQSRTSATASNRLLYFAIPAEYHGQRVAVRVSQPLSDIRRVALNARRVGFAALAIALAIALVVAYRAMRSVSRPVARLSSAAELIGRGELGTRIPVVPTELGPIADALSELRDEVRERIGALSRERSHLSTVLDGLEAAALLVDGHTIVFANRATSRLFREPVSSWPGVRIENSGLPAGLTAEILAGLEGEPAAGRDLEPLPTGTTYRLLVHPPAPGDEPAMGIVVIEDVTERATVERLRSDFVANASHELKTPVAAIGLLSQSLHMALDDEDPEAVALFARQMAERSEALRLLVADLLDLSRLENGSVEDSITDAREAIDRAVVSHRFAAERKAIELTVDTAGIEGADVYVACDPTDLAIALDNLIDNAIRYTTEGAVSIAVSADALRVRIRVSDTGTGISEEHSARIFERFYRVDSGRSRDDGGTGLGLSLVKNVVERHQGSVSLESSSAEGSTFMLEFPRA